MAFTLLNKSSKYKFESGGYTTIKVVFHVTLDRYISLDDLLFEKNLLKSQNES